MCVIDSKTLDSVLTLYDGWCAHHCPCVPIGDNKRENVVVKDARV